jgi:hypothetical protein
MKKSQNMLVWVRKMGFLDQQNCTLCAVVARNRRTVTLPVRTCRNAYTEYDLTAAAAQCFWLAHHHNDWSRWFAISTPLTCLFAVCPSFSFIGGVAKRVKYPKPKLRCEKHVWRVTYWAALLLEMLFKLIRQDWKTLETCQPSRVS